MLHRAKIIIIALLSLTMLSATPHKPAGHSGKIQWMSFEEAVAKARQEPKKIFIDVYTDWCGWCKKMDQVTFNQSGIAEYMNEHYYNVKLDAEQKGDITFNGHTFKYIARGQRGVHELAAALLQNKLSYPTVVFMDEQLNLITPVPGFQQPASFDKIMRFIGEDIYKEQSWEDYMARATSQYE